MSELRECPFCGGEAQITKTNHATWVECLNYHYERHQVSVHAKTEAEAIEAWNTRAERTCKLGGKVPAFDMTLNMLADIPWYWCSECGAATPSISNYCMHCGAKVVGE